MGVTLCCFSLGVEVYSYLYVFFNFVFFIAHTLYPYNLCSCTGQMSAKRRPWSEFGQSMGIFWERIKRRKEIKPQHINYKKSNTTKKKKQCTKNIKWNILNYVKTPPPPKNKYSLISEKKRILFSKQISSKQFHEWNWKFTLPQLVN